MVAPRNVLATTASGKVRAPLWLWFLLGFVLGATWVLAR